MRYRIYTIMIIAGLLFGMHSCKNDVPAADVDVELHTRVLTEGENTTDGLLFFWDSYNFDILLEGNEVGAKPISEPVQIDDIGYYGHEKGHAFKVGIDYPKDRNEYIYATGYAPINALEFENNDYSKLKVSENNMSGQTDFLYCDGNNRHRGSASDLFTKAEHELKFRHLTPRILFVGIRDTMMHGVISVNNVEVTLYEENKLKVPINFVRYSDRDSLTYKVNDLSPLEELVLSPQTSDYIPTTESGQNLFSCYAFCGDLPSDYNPFNAPSGSSGKVVLKMNISADYSWYTPDKPVFFEKRTWENKSVDIDLKHGDNCFYPGYQYVIKIIFKDESVVLQGVQQNWEDGGIHYLPITPSVTQ